MKTNLILHCGARSVDRQTLANIPCPPHTDTWHPIPHIELVNQVERSLASSGMAIINEAFGVTEDNARMFGLLQIGLAGTVAFVGPDGHGHHYYDITLPDAIEKVKVGMKYIFGDNGFEWIVGINPIDPVKDFKISIQVYPD